jgi:glyoxylase-like metal-dependent hydrolase (beta-lactamase superfamily II)
VNIELGRISYDPELLAICHHSDQDSKHIAMAPSELKVHYLSSSEKGLSSVSTLIVGSKAAALIDPPFLVPDAQAVASWIKEKTSLPLKAVFVTHHHPDHYFSANPILDAHPGATLYAAPYGKLAI